MERYRKLKTDIEKFNYCQTLMDMNEVLYYKFLKVNIKELAPIIYTPTVGKACLTFGEIYRRPRGMYLSVQDKGDMLSMIYNFPVKDVDIIVMTDGGRILGLGDLGANGMGIPVGKLALYVAAGGIHPGRVLPITIDVGTNNEKLRGKDSYLGMDIPRLQGDEYYEVVDEAMRAIKQRWPDVLIQFEDFSSDKAHTLLDKYRYSDEEYLCFNDDIQGTGAVIVSGLFNALRANELNYEEIMNQKIVIVGGGSAGIGVAEAIKAAMKFYGFSEKEALNQFYILDKDGLITSTRNHVTDPQRPFANIRKDLPDGLSLVDTIKEVKPDILLGISGCGGIFTEEVVKTFHEHSSRRPIIFPLSNPTSKAECTAEDCYNWTNGEVIFASGSPFEPVTIGDNCFYPSQGNNMFIFPGLGLGAILCKAHYISDKMLFAASTALAETVPDEFIECGRVYPDVTNIREVSAKVAFAVIKEALANNNYRKRVLGRMSDDNLRAYIDTKMWKPKYTPIIPHSS
eukprot:CAMPEP_0117420870 /NCGR_PEP_ID=MMETSP0758-20121206/2115_1 /TAXON_ID=63605 /ORGANISM="Percolomonas cosmopolitus, Strain AE-1 (ATCC 50343)" /LENGTH=511 /DNA_ID=CAMNT_0005202733 /DNA_START=276 /DNA_END=1811 /DNA_ORIENTATION=-